MHPLNLIEMKAVAYSIKPFEKEFLAKANQKKHDITLISNSLGMSTVDYAQGKTAVIVFTNDDVSASVIELLSDLGIRLIITRSVGTDHIDLKAAEKNGIQVLNVSDYGPQAIAEHTLMLALALSRQLVKADRQVHKFDFRNDQLIGFNLSGKTVGIIGLGQIGQAAARIFSGLGCTVLGTDLYYPADFELAIGVSFEELLDRSDIISLHLPLNVSSRHLINRKAISMMKDGVMLLNTSRGGLINTAQLLPALQSGKIGYLGLDVYEYEKGLFFEDHEHDPVKDRLLGRLLKQDNIIITPHQAYLTQEALQEIANIVIEDLDIFQKTYLFKSEIDINGKVSAVQIK